MCNSSISNTSISNFAIKELYKKGVRFSCISPGSRNTPFTVSLLNFKKIKCISVIDERSSAYFGLGLAKATQTPVIILTTSGTATANLFPAIIEASLDSIPLVIITADRPKKLIYTGASQTINQNNIYGEYVRKMVDYNPDKKSINTKLKNFYKTINYAIGDEHNIPGPIHLNFRFNKPLLDKGKKISANIKDYKQKRQSRAITLPKFNSPLIICGSIPPEKSLTNIIELSKRINAPIIADTLSQLRHFKEVNAYYDQYIESLKFLPDIIIRFGSKPISRKLNNFLNKHKKITYLLKYHIYNDDCTNFIQSDFKNLKTIKIPLNKNNSFKNYINKLEKESSEKIQSRTGSLNSSVKLLNNILPVLAKNDNIFIGSSTILRTFDQFTGNFSLPLKIYSNNHTRGIDGIVSSALGMAYANKKTKNYLFIGDISLFYDANAFHILKNKDIDLTIFVFNNNGGQIFSRLPYANSISKGFKDFWITPVKATIKNLAILFDLKYLKITTFSNLKTTISNLKNSKGTNIVEIKVNNKIDIKFLKTIEQLSI